MDFRGIQAPGPIKIVEISCYSGPRPSTTNQKQMVFIGFGRQGLQKPIINIRFSLLFTPHAPGLSKCSVSSLRNHLRRRAYPRVPVDGEVRAGQRHDGVHDALFVLRQLRLARYDDRRRRPRRERPIDVYVKSKRRRRHCHPLQRATNDGLRHKCGHRRGGDAAAAVQQPLRNAL